MGIYWDNKIYGIRWYKVDEHTDNFCLIYEYKSSHELKTEEINEIKQNFELINQNELSRYQFYLYQQVSISLEPNLEPCMMWNKTDLKYLTSYLKTNKPGYSLGE